MKEFNRFDMQYLPLSSRWSKVDIQTTSVEPVSIDISGLDDGLRAALYHVTEQILQARQKDAAVICAFGAHAIKNGLGRVIGSLFENGWFTHICTNGAGIIHDWEFSYLGKSSEDVRKNVQVGNFGTWEETGLYINLALVLGAYRGLGYGESVGEMILNDGLEIPSLDQLEEESKNPRSPLWKRAAALDLIQEISACNIPSGFLTIEHPYKEYSIQSYAARAGKPFTCHPMFGHDIIYTHHANQGASIGRTAEKDFLSYVESVSNLENGVYLSVGSAVMSPMIFEKALSMSRNVAIQRGRNLHNFHIHVIDLQKSTWDWSKGEPPIDNPAYYLRFMKTFNRMGGTVDYTCCDNKLFFQSLLSMSKEIAAHE